MQQPKMIVLGLLSMGLRYGFEMEKFAADTNMRLWARIGMSTIYKTLKDLERDGSVIGETVRSNKGPERVAYAVTAKGRRQFRALVTDALRARTPVYSDRMAGLVFAPLLPTDKAQGAIRSCIEGLERAGDRALDLLDAQTGDVVAEAIIGFYRDVHAAERKALGHVQRALRPRSPASRGR